MLGVTSLSKENYSGLAKTITADPAEMAEIKNVISQIISAIIKRTKANPHLHNKDLQSLYRRLYFTKPNVGMKTSSISTYCWLFGFNDNGHNYLNTTNSVSEDRLKFGITFRHIFFMQRSLSELRLIHNTACPVSLNPAAQCNLEAIWRFLNSSYREITGVDRTEPTKKRTFVSTGRQNYPDTTNVSLGTEVPEEYRRCAINLVNCMPYPLDKHFSDLLFWHLFTNNTRPKDRFMTQWSLASFADAIDVDVDVVEGWIQEETDPDRLPQSTQIIEEFLFEDNPLHNLWRIDLRRSACSARKRSLRTNQTLCGQQFFSAPSKRTKIVVQSQIIRRMEALLLPERSAKYTGQAIILGPPKSGKTSVAVGFAHRYRYSFAGVCWCYAETRESLIGCLAEMSSSLGEDWIDRGNWGIASNTALSKIVNQERPWLFIYENVFDLRDIADLLPRYPVSLIATACHLDKDYIDGRFAPNSIIELEML